MRVLVACEESQTVTKAFRDLGHEAFSCDLQPTRGNPDWHIQGDAIRATYDLSWDLMIGHPPCTHLACSGAKHFWRKEKEQAEGLEFVKALMDAPIHKICIENPVSVISTRIREPDQIIQPYYFGDEAQKTTCLWLKNLPPLVHQWRDDLFGKCQHVGKGEFITFPSGKRMAKWISKPDAKVRSKTFPGIAKAMAEQWTT